MQNLFLVRTIVLAGTLSLQLTTFCFDSDAAAGNDRFSDAQVISGPTGTTTDSNNGASKEPGEPDHAGVPGGSSIWFRWTAPASGRFSFNTAGSSFDTLLAVYTGMSVTNLTVIDSNDDYGFDVTSEVSIPALAGTTYQIAVDGYDNETGSVLLNWAPEVPPGNDNFANATVITGTNGSLSANNSGATLEPGEPNHAGEPGGRSVWFRWTAPITGQYSMSTAGSAVDTLLGVYTGASVNALTAVATNDNFEGQLTSQLTFRGTSGTTYSVAIDGYQRHAGSLVLSWAFIPDDPPELPASNFRTLHSFMLGTDGRGPHSELILSGNALYGTTVGGGASSAGTVFKINTDGTGYSVLHSFTSIRGANPFAGLILSNGILYGTTRAGGTSGYGTVFALTTNGTGFTNLHHFTAAPGTPGTNSDGATPVAPLALSGSGRMLYGTSLTGGTSGRGTVFAVNTNGSGFTNLHNFTAQDPSGLNIDGATPYSGLVVSGNTLYGTALNGGSEGFGTVFALKTNGLEFTTLHNFQWTSSGAHAHTLILSGNTLYGTANDGGPSGFGTVFAVKTDGTGFTNLHRFPAVFGTFNTNDQGANPFSVLALSGNTLYGTTLGGGRWGKGTIFTLNTSGTGFRSLYHFREVSGSASTNSGGASPRAGVVVSGDTLYGTAERGGSAGYGTVFSLSLLEAPRLTITPAGANVRLSWPTRASAFNLEGTTNLALPNSWWPVGQPAVTNSGEISVTVPSSERTSFFRLKSP